MSSLFPTQIKRKYPPFYYQEDAVISLHKDWEMFNKLICVCPTGAGKSNIAGECLARVCEAGSQGIFLAHTSGLAEQAAEALRENFGLHTDIEMGNLIPDPESHVICGTFQTMMNRLHKYNPKDIGLLVIDEAHRSLGKGYQKIADYFSGRRILGLTASPRRTDQKDLMKFFDRKSVDIPLDKLIKENFLSHIVIENIPIEITIHGESKSGDITEEEAGHALEPYLDQLADQYVQRAKDKCGLVFLPLIDISKKFCERLKERGVKAEHVDGNIKRKDKNKFSKLLSQLRSGEIECLCNSMILTEGIDIRPVNYIFCLRPTKSWTLLVQIIGRGTRLFDPEKHDPTSKWPKKGKLYFGDPLWVCDDLNPLQRPEVLFAKDDEEVKAMRKKIEDGEGDLLDAHVSVLKDRAQALKDRIEANARKQQRLVSAIDFFLSIGRQDLAEYEPMGKWEEGNMSTGQVDEFIRQEISIYDADGNKLKFGNAKMILDNVFERAKKGLATLKQAKLAQTLGLENSYLLSKSDVHSFIERNIWKLKK